MDDEEIPWGDGVKISDMQSGIAVNGTTISGTLKYLAEGSLVTTYGPGNFIGLKFTNLSANATSVKVGVDPSEGTGLVEIINDPDKEATIKITSKRGQMLVVEQSDDLGHKIVQKFSLASLNCEDSVG